MGAIGVHNDLDVRMAACFQPGKTVLMLSGVCFAGSLSCCYLSCMYPLHATYWESSNGCALPNAACSNDSSGMAPAVAPLALVMLSAQPSNKKENG